MKILLHICCAPCSIYPVKTLRSEGMNPTGFFYNNNIHPYTEYVKRRDALAQYAKLIGLGVVFRDDYDLEGFLRATVFREANRCAFCYFERLNATAHYAKEAGYDSFTTTLLYSIYQKHDLIKEIGESAGKSAGIPFYYRDFRPGWKEGVNESKRLELYRQKYCGCIFSEKERYLKTAS
ncbi:MAG: epoxyqueuosine reductase QueH [Desulfobacterales bacterium]|nr:epoxyqueuosine reductase QueH [Desulfobacterales bacterium]